MARLMDEMGIGMRAVKGKGPVGDVGDHSLAGGGGVLNRGRRQEIQFVEW